MSAILKTRPKSSDSGFDSVFQNSLAHEMAAGRWQDLVAGMGADLTTGVRQTLARVAELVRSHRLGEEEARWLQERLQPMYETGLSAQRLSRLADHTALRDVEPVQLDDLVAEAVVHHQRLTSTRRIAAELTALEVLAQPDALSSAVDSLITWAVRLGRVVTVRIEKPDDVSRGELWVKVEHLERHAHDDHNINSVDWYVLWQLARLKGVKVRRKVEPHRVRVVIQFDRVPSRQSVFAPLFEVAEIAEETLAFDPEVTTVWTVVPSKQLTATIVDTLRTQIRHVHSLPSMQALASCESVPDCIVSVSEVTESHAFRSWRRAWQHRLGRSIAVIELTQQRNIFDIGGTGARAVARVSADSVDSKLLAAVVFELSHLCTEGL